MKYVIFKNYVYKTLKDKYDFIKEGKEYYYDNEEMRIFFNIDKSQYSNSAIINVWISIKSFCKFYNREVPTSYHFADIAVPFIKEAYYNLDECNDFIDIEEKLEKFFANDFQSFTNIKSLKEHYEKNNIKPSNEHLSKFLNLK